MENNVSEKGKPEKEMGIYQHSDHEDHSPFPPAIPVPATPRIDQTQTRRLDCTYTPHNICAGAKQARTVWFFFCLLVPSLCS
jgi:hypothetical protein